MKKFLFNWKYFSLVNKENLESLKYEKIIKKINKKKSKNLYEVENFIVQNTSIYGTLTALSLAKKYVECNNLDKAFLRQFKTIIGRI